MGPRTESHMKINLSTLNVLRKLSPDHSEKFIIHSTQLSQVFFDLNTQYYKGCMSGLNILINVILRFSINKTGKKFLLRYIICNAIFRNRHQFESIPSYRKNIYSLNKCLIFIRKSLTFSIGLLSNNLLTTLYLNEVDLFIRNKLSRDAVCNKDMTEL